jgi:hypothetical protein
MRKDLPLSKEQVGTGQIRAYPSTNRLPNHKFDYDTAVAMPTITNQIQISSVFNLLYFL